MCPCGVWEGEGAVVVVLLCYDVHCAYLEQVGTIYSFSAHSLTHHTNLPLLTLLAWRSLIRCRVQCKGEGGQLGEGSICRGSLHSGFSVQRICWRSRAI